MKRKKTFFIIILSIPVVLFLYLSFFALPKMFDTPAKIFVTPQLTDEISSDYEFKDIVARATLGNGWPLPKESKNIFACNDKAFQDPSYWLVFELPIVEVQSFVEKITKTKFTDFIDGVHSEYSHVNKRPKDWVKGNYVGKEYWDINSVTNGRHYEKEQFYCGVDMDRGKIFLCFWTT
jgi:hypothetical protein